MSLSLEAKFKQATSSQGGYLRVSATHPVDLFVGIENGRRSVFLLCNEQPPEPPQLEAIEVLRRQRDDGKWAMLIQLKREELGGMFSYLATDLVTATMTATSADAAAGILVERLRWWQRLLSRGRSTVLAESALRGLIAELLFLADHVIPEEGAEAAVAAWVGPFEAPRDFRFQKGDVEVKSVWRDSASVRITSVEQLEDGGVPIKLGIVVLEPSQSGTADSFSCAGLIARLRRLCEPSETAVSALNERLWAVGYTDIPEYQDIYFASRPFTFFDCREDFPRIRRIAVPGGHELSL